VLYAHALGLVPITTPAYSPESNGLAEAFVHTFKRDYVLGAELRDAETVLAQLGGWVDDYNRQKLTRPVISLSVKWFGPSASSTTIAAPFSRRYSSRR
jgi:transposase InsO family protein